MPESGALSERSQNAEPLVRLQQLAAYHVHRVRAGTRGGGQSYAPSCHRNAGELQLLDGPK